MLPDADFPDSIVAVVLKALSKKSEDRYQSVDELLGAFNLGAYQPIESSSLLCQEARNKNVLDLRII